MAARASNSQSNAHGGSLTGRGSSRNRRSLTACRGASAAPPSLLFLSPTLLSLSLLSSHLGYLSLSSRSCPDRHCCLFTNSQNKCKLSFALLARVKGNAFSRTFFFLRSQFLPRDKVENSIVEDVTYVCMCIGVCSITNRDIARRKERTHRCCFARNEPSDWLVHFLYFVVQLILSNRKSRTCRWLYVT